MDCRIFREKIGPYLEGELAERDMTALKGHLESCPQCRKDLEDLEKTRACLGALQEVEPPPWFEQKIMAGVREAGEGKSLWHRLFYPLHVKVPVQALAAIIVVVFAVHVFRDMEPQMKSPAMKPVPPAGQLAQTREAQHGPSVPEKKPVAPAPGAPAAPAEKPARASSEPGHRIKAEIDAVTRAAAPEFKPAAQPPVPAAVPAPVPDANIMSNEAAPPPGALSSPAPFSTRLKEKEMVVGQRQEKKRDEDSAYLDYAPSAAKGKAAVSEYARKPAGQVNIRIRPHDAGTAVENIKRLLGESGAANISTDAPGKISAELPADRWSGFAVRLSQLGETKGFPSLPPAVGSIHISITIETNPAATQ